MAWIEYREMDDGVLGEAEDPVTGVRGFTMVRGNLILDCYTHDERSFQLTIQMQRDERHEIHKLLSEELKHEATIG